MTILERSDLVFDSRATAGRARLGIATSALTLSLLAAQYQFQPDAKPDCDDAQRSGRDTASVMTVVPRRGENPEANILVAMTALHDSLLQSAIDLTLDEKATIYAHLWDLYE